MRTLGFALVTALLCAVLPATSASAAPVQPVPLPSSPKGLQAPVDLPTELDPPSAYAPQKACQPGTLPGVAKLRALVMETYGVGGIGNTARTCTEGVSEHADGRAWDWMVNVKNTSERKAAADFLSWLTKDGGANARRLGIMYVIYNAKIWAVYRHRDGWRPSSGHADHIHVSFGWNGARGLTSFWTGRVHPVDHGPCARFTGQPAVVRDIVNSKPCYRSTSLVKSSSQPVLQLGSRASGVATAQGLLKVPRTRVLDAATRSAILKYQGTHDLPRTGTLDKPTWASLQPSSVRSDVTRGFTPAEARAHGAATYGRTTLQERSTGAAVIFLQKGLRMDPSLRAGYFGKKTVAAVKAKQKALGRPQTGVWTSADWKALVG